MSIKHDTYGYSQRLERATAELAYNVGAYRGSERDAQTDARAILAQAGLPGLQDLVDRALLALRQIAELEDSDAERWRDEARAIARYVLEPPQLPAPSTPTIHAPEFRRMGDRVVSKDPRYEVRFTDSHIAYRDPDNPEWIVLQIICRGDKIELSSHTLANRLLETVPPTSEPDAYLDQVLGRILAASMWQTPGRVLVFVGRPR